MADPIPATQDKIIPHWAKPKVCRRKPKAIKLAKKSSEKIITFHASTVVIISKSLPNTPHPPAINPNCMATYAGFQFSGYLDVGEKINLFIILINFILSF